MWRRGNPSALLAGMQTGAAPVENSMEFPQKIKYGTAYDSVITLVGIYPKKLKTLIRKNICTPMFITVLVIITKLWKQPKCPSWEEWTKEQWYIYTMNCYSVIKKNEILPFVTAWMDLEGTMLSKISQPEKDKHHMILHVESKEQNKWSIKRETHRRREQTDGCQTAGVLGNWVKKVNRLRNTNW